MIEKRLAILVTGLLSSSAAFAADMPVKAVAPVPYISNTIVQSNNQISLDFIETSQDYAEVLDPARPGFINGVFDSERGWMPGFSVTGSVMRDDFIQHLYLMGRFSWANGKTGYWSTPVQGRTGFDTKDADFRIGKGFDITSTIMLTPYIGAGYHDWHRDLTPLGAGGYKEDYTHGYVGGGLLFQWAATDRLVFSANGLVGSTFDPRISVTLFPIPPASFSAGLGTSAIYMAGLALDYAITPQWHVNGGVDFMHFHYGESAQLPPDGRYEPYSTTTYVTAKVGIGYSWGAPIVAKY